MRKINIYFAGKVSKGGGYRKNIFADDRIMSNAGRATVEVNDFTIVYAGPIALSCDHGCYHDKESIHGMTAPHGCDGEAGGGLFKNGFFNKSKVFSDCNLRIKACDVFYARIETLDCFGTFLEIGIASSSGKEIVISLTPELAKDNELWFIRQSATYIQIEDSATLNFLKIIHNK